jgi:hypothetical protein
MPEEALAAQTQGGHSPPLTVISPKLSRISNSTSLQFHQRYGEGATSGGLAVMRLNVRERQELIQLGDAIPLACRVRDMHLPSLFYQRSGLGYRDRRADAHRSNRLAVFGCVNRVCCHRVPYEKKPAGG